MNKNKPTKQEENINSTIFVSGLPYTSTEEKITEFFADCGEITYYQTLKI